MGNDTLTHGEGLRVIYSVTSGGMLFYGNAFPTADSIESVTIRGLLHSPVS